MKRKIKGYKWAAGLLCALPVAAFSQQTEPLTGAERLFNDGKQLFLRHDYAVARQTLSQYVSEAETADFRDEADYMLACTAYELGMPDRIDVLKTYLSAHPETRYANRVYSLIASAYFFEGEYREAIAVFRQCEVEALPAEERDACLLRRATSFLKTEDWTAAAFDFSVLKEVSADYRDDAVYNLAYIDYMRGKYKPALEGFLRVGQNGSYAELAPYYIADIYLKTGDYVRAKKTAEAYLDRNAAQKYAVQMARIAGESAFGMEDYASAVRWLDGYCRQTSSPERNALYKLGMSHFKTGVYSKAVECLGKVTGKEDLMAQNAYLHIGLAGLQLKERNQTRMAFERASSMNFDPAVREQALYNYALCIHETSYSPFAESVTVFERFLNEYPNSPYAEKVDNYLVEVYMNTRSYEAALRSIDKISSPGPRILEAKQKLLFRMGTQQFAQADFEGAANYFTRSLQQGQYNQQTKADAYYWRGESEYRMGQYASAANDFRLYMEFALDKRTAEYGLALYNMGYVYFKQKLYDKARIWFQRCVDGGLLENRSVLADSYNRIGDCYFYNRLFAEAEKQYGQAVKMDASLGDYSLFQEGFVKGLQRDYSGKIQTLNRLITDYPQSQYMDDALYEQGRAFVQMDDTENAIRRYKELLGHYPESALSRKAANEIGLLYYQNDRYDEAIAAYKKVISDYPGSEEARLAQRDLRAIYVDLNKVDDYLAFASALPGGGSFDVSERDSLTYVAAERVYLRGNVAEAKASFVRYLQSFPQGAFSTDASYYLGLIAYQHKDYREALTYLEQVLKYSGSKYYGEALAMSAAIAYEDKDYSKALGLYKLLADRSASEEERVQAQLGALRSSSALKDTKEIISAASALLAHSKLLPEIKNEALYCRAKAFVREGRTGEGIADLKVLSVDTRNVYGAEAKYLVAQLYFNEGKTGEAEKEVLDYIEVSTPHAYWLARSFVLLSDVYMKLGKDMEAKQYLLSLQQNYQANDDIAQMIETRLAKLKSVE